MIYRFDTYSLDTDRLELRNDAALVTVEPQVFALLVFLIENRDKVVTKDEIIDVVWKGRIVSDSTLNSRINAARRALDDDGKNQAVIKTFPRRGFRFVAEIKKGDVDKTRSQTSSKLPDIPSIAVLPFKNIGDNITFDFFADGLRLAIQASLVRIPGILLISPSGVKRYLNKEVSVRQIGNELGVRYVLEGSAQRSAETIRVIVQLTDANTQQTVWAERYDRHSSDTLATQDEITLKVIKGIDAKLGQSERALFVHHTLTSLDALDAFFRGLNLFYTQSKKNTAAAIREFESLLRIETESPVAPGYLAMCHWREASMGWSASKDESLRQAVKWAEIGIRYENSDGMAHIVLACVHLLNGRHDEALTTCYEAIKRRPVCPISNITLSEVLNYCGHSAEAIPRAKSAMQIMQVFPSWFPTLLATAYRDLGDPNNSIASANQAIEINQEDINPRLVLCSAYIKSNLPEKAKRVAQEVMEINPTFNLSEYANTQPYKNPQTLKRLINDLRKAGLPEG